MRSTCGPLRYAPRTATAPAPRVRLSPPLSPRAYSRRSASRPPYPLEEEGTSLFARGRHALWHGVRAIGLEGGDEVLVPAYHCGSEVEALTAAGLSCRFYEATETLAPNADELEALIASRTRALYLIHYYGFPQDAGRWRSWCAERGLLLIEDCAQAWLASHDRRPVGSFGDLAIFSPYKTVPVPPVGVARSRPPTPGGGSAGGLGLGSVVKKHVRWLAAGSGRLDAVLCGLDRPHVEDVTLGDPNAGPTHAARLLLPRAGDAEAAGRRRTNYRHLLGELAQRVPPPFRALPAGACPLIFPVEAIDVGDLVERLDRAGIDASPFWPVLHPLLPAAAFPQAVAWHTRFVALPVHHELRPRDLERMAAALGKR